MLKETYHPNAYLHRVRNVRLGLRARTSVLNVLEKGSYDARTVADQASLHYGVVMHHLRLLQSEGLVERSTGKHAMWTLTGAGQKRLVAEN